MTTLIRIIVAAAVCLATANVWSASMLRISCEGDSARAEVSINGQFKGECPMDVEVKAGDIRVRAVKNQNVEVERVFEDSFRLGDGVMKRVEIQLGRPQYTAEGMRRLQARKQAEEEAARRAAEEKERARLQKIAEAEEAKRQAEARLAASMATLREQGVEPGNGKTFRDCPDCPVMVMIPRSPIVKSKPLNEPVAISQHEITRGEFARYLQETGRKLPPGCTTWNANRSAGPIIAMVFKPDLGWNSPGFPQNDDHPAVCVSITEADEYLRWLSEKAGYPYRLPPVDWWYAAAGAATPHDTAPPPVPWNSNNGEACKFGNVFDEESESALNSGLSRLLVWRFDPYGCNDKFAFTAPVGQFPPNSFGLHDMTGNVSEWVTEPDLPDQQGKIYNSLAAGLGWHSAPLIANNPYVFRVAFNLRASFVGFRVMRYLSANSTGH